MIADGTLIGTFTPGRDFLIKTFTVPRGPPPTSSRSMYGEIGMPFWLEQADAEMQELY